MKITWIGHASVLIEVNGFRILTDPALTSRLAHLRRRVPITNIERVDVILISHVHMDHLHSASLRKVSTGTRVIVPIGSERLVNRLGAATIQSVAPGAQVNLIANTKPKFAAEVHVVHAEHKLTRGPHSSVRAEPVGYIVETAGHRIYFAGDTDLFDGMRALGPIDVALMPIWGWGATLGPHHLDPETAALATSWIQPRSVVPIHWGTYSPIRLQRGDPSWLTTPLDRFRSALATNNMEDRLVALKPGASIEIK